jgi:hypothetical protein
MSHHWGLADVERTMQSFSDFSELKPLLGSGYISGSMMLRPDTTPQLHPTLSPVVEHSIRF